MRTLTAAAAAACALVLLTSEVPRAAGIGDDLDAFMAKVLAGRDENWKKLQQYVLDEREQVEIRGPGNLPVWGEVREFTWYLNDGFFARSPLTVNGVTVSEADRRKYEADYLKRVKDRDRPQFVDTAYFLKFKFESSKYALVGRETFEGREVLEIEYYPARLFSREQDRQQRRVEQKESDAERDRAAALERMMNKVALVTIWVDPGAHQIVKYTFDNVNLEFLPAAWLLHMDTVQAVMTMSQPMPAVWLPRDVEMRVKATLAIGSFDARYRVDYTNYRQAETNSRFRVIPP